MKHLICALLVGVCALAHATTYQNVPLYYDGDSTTQGITVLGGTPSCNDGVSTTGCTPHDYGHNVTGGTGYIEAYNEPDEVQIQMDKAFGIGGVTVLNHGVGGMTVLDSINGTGGYNCSVNGANSTGTCGTLVSRLQASHALIVVGHFLTNDQYRMTSSQFQTYVSTWINTVQGTLNADGQPMTAFWEESAPICRNDAPNVGPYLTADRTAAAAAGVTVIDNHDWIYSNVDWIPHLPDCVHPDGSLYITMGDRAASAMSRTVQILLGR